MSEPHELGHAADVRVREYPIDTRVRAVDHLNRVFQRRFMDSYPTAIYETPETSERATGPHIHIQVPHYPTPGWAVEIAMPTTEDLPRGIL